MPVPYPPEPWHLCGDMHAALWLLPGSVLPPWTVPEEVRPLSVGGRRALVTFWVDYRADGDLAYRELLITLVVRHGRTVAATAVQAWVDDERSMAGGRRLWAIPKQLADLRFETPVGSGHRRAALHARVTPRRAGRREPAATALCRELLRLPVRLPLRAHLLQRRDDGTTCRVPLHVVGRPSWTRVRWRVDPHGPLGYLSGRKPVAAVSLRDFRFTVGAA
ncbi:MULTISPECIES: acetoacetate decarboxylase family protein [Streptomyces]|uniref:Acetoacetate decarboxylase family protein n=1 Tax=Streptomyces thermoviolaceus subsp. thermoviolaceus TaxID=66860 RepID=A0ABX0YSE5_STRTL|nr:MULTISPECIES: acetoacetate decarboxylase family protein [Streptomyces]MCM3262508.1 acetoacetate decarboxylase family protein [Streptomyces thermoviolaceus]NJP14071.1 acetoacetate decarboxylase family protein [Streptomyces thermoviolaceus subsp. thermoviolaceus]WTD50422.1 acetoacetate decarboxylase family protein [Streptomyces thermoviolaceus]GGV63219.1 acetoacetate decarboxylase [Streptomyces thermoviolaceus subsp. apingens]GHA90663.1 acetoacetate decarboxylase [Streptomyces thermoviolaceus